MNTVKNYITIHLWLIWIVVLEVVILLMACLIKYPNKTEGLNLSMLNMITGINKSKNLTEHISCKCKYKFDGRTVIQIKSGIMINVSASVKNIIYVKKIIFGMQLHVVAKMVNISVIICDGITDTEAKSYDKETKTVTTNFNKKKCNL